MREEEERKRGEIKRMRVEGEWEGEAGNDGGMRGKGRKREAGERE